MPSTPDSVPLLFIMKRFLVTILSILYMASAMGATVHIHYCMGEKVGAGFIHKDTHRCAKCGMVKTTSDNGCCKDEHKTLKTSEHQLAKAILDVQLQAPASLPVVFDHSRAVFAGSFAASRTGLYYTPPLLWRSCPLYLLHCNFRI
jgi:hypothetical protein